MATDVATATDICKAWNQDFLDAIVGDVQHIAGPHRQIFGLLVKHFLEVDLGLRLFPLVVLANNDGVIQLRDFGCSPSKRQDFHGGHFRTIVGKDEATGPVDCAQHIHNASVRNGDYISRLQTNIVLGDPMFQEFA